MKRLLPVLLAFLISCGSINKRMMGPYPAPLGVHFTNVKVTQAGIDFDAIVNVNKHTEHITVFIDIAGDSGDWYQMNPVNLDVPPDVLEQAEHNVGITLPLRASLDTKLVKITVQAFRGPPTTENPLWHKKREESRVFKIEEILAYQ